MQHVHSCGSVFFFFFFLIFAVVFVIYSKAIKGLGMNIYILLCTFVALSHQVMRTDTYFLEMFDSVDVFYSTDYQNGL